VYVIPPDVQGRTLRIQEIWLQVFPVGEERMWGLTPPLSTVLSVGSRSN